MQPADAFDCVEVIRATATDDVALERACDAVRATQKLPIVLSKPIEGFLFDRLQHALLHEAYYLIGASHYHHRHRHRHRHRATS
jgi:3-hydroxybutyryl-CoA dehydrogenase